MHYPGRHSPLGSSASTFSCPDCSRKHALAGVCHCSVCGEFDYCFPEKMLALLGLSSWSFDQKIYLFIVMYTWCAWSAPENGDSRYVTARRSCGSEDVLVGWWPQLAGRPACTAETILPTGDGNCFYANLTLGLLQVSKMLPFVCLFVWERADRPLHSDKWTNQNHFSCLK
jgi:hypothetical protein